jgi:glycosyltransferase involved in cell wall biosynthesis
MVALREKGVELFLACRENAKIKDQAMIHGFTVFTLPFKGNTDIKTLLKLIAIIKNNKINIINTHSGKDTWVGGLAAKFSGIKFIRTRHLSNPIRSSRLNFINELADYIFTTGESVKEDMIQNNRINPNNIMSIPTGIDETVFNPKMYDKSVSREKFNIQEDELVIGIVAVLRQFKRHDIFIHMAQKLLAYYPEKKLKFIIAGEGPQRMNIEALIKKENLSQYIHLIGHISNVAEFLSAIDIFTLTSDSKEGVPQSVMQALLMEKSVIATDVAGTKDLLCDDNFILVEPNSVDALVKKVSLFIEESEMRGSYKARARGYVMEGFSKDAMTIKIFNVYEKLLR